MNKNRAGKYSVNGWMQLPKEKENVIDVWAEYNSPQSVWTQQKCDIPTLVLIAYIFLV